MLLSMLLLLVVLLLLGRENIAGHIHIGVQTLMLVAGVHVVDHGVAMTGMDRDHTGIRLGEAKGGRVAGQWIIHAHIMVDGHGIGEATHRQAGLLLVRVILMAGGGIDHLLWLLLLVLLLLLWGRLLMLLLIVGGFGVRGGRGGR